MKSNIRMYGQEFNSDVIKDVKKLNEKIESETDPEELLKLRMQRLYRGMEINTAVYKRNYQNLFPF